MELKFLASDALLFMGNKPKPKGETLFTKKPCFDALFVISLFDSSLFDYESLESIIKLSTLQYSV